MGQTLQQTFAETKTALSHYSFIIEILGTFFKKNERCKKEQCQQTQMTHSAALSLPGEAFAITNATFEATHVTMSTHMDGYNTVDY